MNYRITKTYGRYYNTYEATLSKRFSFLGITIWFPMEFTRGKNHMVNDQMNEWIDQYRIGSDNIIDKTEKPNIFI